MQGEESWRAERERWEHEVVSPFLESVPERQPHFETPSGETLERVFTPEHVESDAESAGFPGESASGPMRTHRIAVIAGDGIGREVIPVGMRVLSRAAALDGSFRLDFEELPWGCDYYERTGRMMAENAS